MAWLERHEPRIDWRLKTLGATRNVPSEALEDHEPTFARQQQKHYWREPLTEDVNVLEIGMSELTNSNVENMNTWRSSLNISDTARTPLSVTRCDNESLHTESMVGLGPSYQNCNSFDVCRVTRENAPSAVGREGTTLNVGNDIISRIERPTSSSNHGDTIVPTPEGCKISSKRRPRRQVATVKRQASVQSHSDNSDTLYTLVNGVTGQVEGNVSLETLPSFGMLFVS